MTIDQMIKMDAIIGSENAKLKVLRMELADIKEKILAYRIKRVKEKFPDIEIDENGEGLNRKTRSTIFKFTQRQRLEDISVDDDPAEVNLYFDPVYKEMFKKERSLQKTIQTRTVLMDHAKQFEGKYADFKEILFRREELALEIERLNDQIKELEQTIDSSKKHYFVFKEAYQQLKNEYNCKD